jgi:hypothetical protein
MNKTAPRCPLDSFVDSIGDRHPCSTWPFRLYIKVFSILNKQQHPLSRLQ